MSDFGLGIKKRLSALLDQCQAELSIKLTLILLLFYNLDSWLVLGPLKLLCAIMLISSNLRKNGVFWLLLTGILLYLNFETWALTDNHKFLITYWVLACALGISSDHLGQVLAHNGRMLIALVFLCATLWKCFGGEYDDGSFLHFTFLEDGRLKMATALIGGLDDAAITTNRLLISLASVIPHEGPGVTLSTTPALILATKIFSYWILLIESLIAISFLFLYFKVLSRWRDWFLIIFLITTYALLPVLGFSSILSLMGFAQCPPERIWAKRAYLFIFFALPVMHMPWRHLTTWIYQNIA